MGTLVVWMYPNFLLCINFAWIIGRHCIFLHFYLLELVFLYHYGKIKARFMGTCLKVTFFYQTINHDCIGMKSCSNLQPFKKWVVARSTLIFVIILMHYQLKNWDTKRPYVWDVFLTWKKNKRIYFINANNHK